MRVSCLITIGYSLVAATALPAQAVISGNDDRTEYFQGTATQKQAADGVFALIHDSHIDHSDPMDIRFVRSSYGEDYGLCPEERFWGQPDPMWYGAFLVSDNEIVTAGHCVDSTKSNRVPSRARDVGSRGGLTFKRRSGI